ncbi:MAG: 4-(cytidine 5'-diphospho)-2-C-methyl-D-erythritol kinase [Cyclobacteriaceae bacterium]|nr:4-(cytidine 5'-diphospho)-2-C-methyl-D-erythritol kinase [Flammeovirgaceae bacterium]MCZ8023279.1 4-(cytidine 5'-diphospho)-2-C-methyl-D-erythritol kinase [Cytophagales bacterium]MCZ8329608.1 4-(cytidine 5'-diphospho)-2-C-methyl-D-erythritol kinase [Cyclobacteriaceae bacterium]
MQDRLTGNDPVSLLIMVVFPHCKINLGLHVLYKRADGYHELDTCFYPITFHDLLEVLPAKNFSVTLTGLSIPGNKTDNICVMAYRLLQQEYQLPNISIHLHKEVPIGAGLGGGSSDGVFTLKALNTIFNLGITPEKMLHYASQLGSDCAFFCQDNPMIGRGRGELLSPVSVSLKHFYLILLKPPIHISTKTAFAGLKPKERKVSIEKIVTQVPVDKWKDHLSNDFEESIFKLYPEIEACKTKLYDHGAVYASMTGSGAGVYGLFNNETDVVKFQDKNLIWRGRLL